MVSKYVQHWLIRHPDYGVLVGLDFCVDRNAERPKFTRSYGAYDNGLTFLSLEAAQAALRRCQKANRFGMVHCHLIEATEEGYVFIPNKFPKQCLGCGRTADMLPEDRLCDLCIVMVKRRMMT
jgi:hypothetical protein